MKRARVLVVLGLAAVVLRLGVACVIDLDPPLAPQSDATADQVSEVALPSNDARPDAVGVECLQDTDCRSEPGAGVGCVDTKCVAGACVFDFCPTGKTCFAKACDVEAGAGTCQVEQPIGFTAGTFTFATDTPIQTLPCASGANLSRCFAAAYPFVFAAQTRQSPSTIFAFAYPVADVTATEPEAIPVEGVDFVPANIVRSAELVFFIGKVQSAASNNLIPIAWLEVPRDPRAKAMKATKVTLTYTAAAGTVPAVFPAPDAGIMIASGINTLLIHAPIAASTVLAPFPPGAGTAVGAPIAQSRDRLVVVQTTGTGAVTAQLIKNAGTGGGIVIPQPAQDVTSGVGRAAPGQVMFAQTPEGVVVSNVAVSRFDGGVTVGTDAVRVSWLIEPSLAIGTSADAGLTIATYTGLNTRLTGPIAAVDPTRSVAFGLEPPSGTFGQLVERSDGGVVSAMPTRRDSYDGGPATYSTATSDGWVYLFQASSASVSVRILQPSCDVP